MKVRTLVLLAAVSLAAGSLLTAGCPGHAQPAPAPTNEVEALQRRLDEGKSKLAYAEDGHGYLASLLSALHIPRESQLLVFSGSSLQFDHINQTHPRALYFQDDIALGSVHDGHLLEIITSDSKSGVAFYSLDVAKADKPELERHTTDCIVCHGVTSLWAPGPMIASFETGPNGQTLNLDPQHLFHLTDDRTPFEQRYGGWYVTGQTGAMQHHGNVTFDPMAPYQVPPGGLNLMSLSDRIDTARYLEPGSDIVALLTLEHQAALVSLITRLNAQVRGPDGDALTSPPVATDKDITASIEELVAYMTFADAQPLPSPVVGSSRFTQTFAERGPFDPRHRSLRQFRSAQPCVPLSA